MLRKCSNHDDLFYYLLEYRNSPLCGLNVSPAELLSNRILRSSLPVSNNILQPKVVNVYDKRLQRQGITKDHHDKTAKQRCNFQLNDNVLVKVRKEDMSWEPAKVVEEYPAPRSYIVQDQSGHTYRKNSSFLKHTKNETLINPSCSTDNFDYSESTECNNNSYDKDEEQQNISGNINDPGLGVSLNKSSRPGRCIKRPQRFDDFVTY
uniref:Uncharacterized protein LOC114345703 n=1 Tax=Diabrotica virgifera virgifera TaxID=50390 RepID=A0A6P7H3N0_DIAVI